MINASASTCCLSCNTNMAFCSYYNFFPTLVAVDMKSDYFILISPCYINNCTIIYKERVKCLTSYGSNQTETTQRTLRGNCYK